MQALVASDELSKLSKNMMEQEVVPNILCHEVEQIIGHELSQNMIEEQVVPSIISHEVGLIIEQELIQHELDMHTTCDVSISAVYNKVTSSILHDTLDLICNESEQKVADNLVELIFKSLFTE